MEKVTRKLGGNQDYGAGTFNKEEEKRDLTMRISPKWKNRFWTWRHKVISDAPIFKMVVKKPNKYRISKKHLELFKERCNLPEEVYQLYDDCQKLDFEIKLFSYLTGD